jgi:F420H(2)-dependent quinone reductase
VQIWGQRFRARARVATPAEKPEMWHTMVGHWPDYDRYQELTEREIPVVVLECVEFDYVNPQRRASRSHSPERKRRSSSANIGRHPSRRCRSQRRRSLTLVSGRAHARRTALASPWT